MSAKKLNTNQILVILIGLVAILGASCCGVWQLVRQISLPSAQEPTPAPEDISAFTVAYSPEKEETFLQLVAGFNEQVASGSEQILRVSAVRYEPDLMIEAALEGSLHAISPDSSIWLNALDREWEARTGRESPLVGQTERYAVSPIVIAMWEDVARSMGYPEANLGWADLLARAQSDPAFKWSHPSTNSAAGLLATLAEFYAGAGKTRGLTEEDVQRQATLDYVAAIEKTVRYYGEGEWSVIQRIRTEGRAYLDAFVCQEQLVIYYNTSTTGDRLVAIYPVEGTLWEDHPIALLELDTLTDQQRNTYNRLVEYLKAPERQTQILASGFRPTDLSIPLAGAGSPFSAENGVDPTQPKTALQMPAPSVVEVVRDVWWYTKRHTNVYLVVDVSGSMEGTKLYNAQEALRVFLEQVQGDTERIGLIAFSSSADEVVPLDELKRTRQPIAETIDELEAYGDTALLDAVALAYARLQALNDAERINAIVVMTDGRENNSYIRQDDLVRLIIQQNQEQLPVVLFCIGYGSDADEKTLRALAESSGGQYFTGDLDTIRRLYKVLSAYF
ncbi:MAG: VWA domain-containing protein [Anaerolineae bacterium]|nr:VWA domain-containing protein [Anaerolineae bacterium]